MNIAFDAKRAYRNNTGLGNYSRNLITSLAEYYPEHHYYLMTPEITERFIPLRGRNITPIEPLTFPSSWLKSVWRSNWMKNDLENLHINLYHGLSHEIPIGISRKDIKTVVTIHDLIFERYPEQYSRIDVRIYRNKFKYACENAHRIIAISGQTKEDIIDFYGIDAAKIDVCYQSCNTVFQENFTEEDLKAIQLKYQLPNQYFLSVGSLIERKNYLNILKAFKMLKGKIATPLVIVGDGSEYNKLEAYVKENGLEQHIIFLSYNSDNNEMLNKFPKDLAGIFRMAKALIYNSLFEGFGIPIIEAFSSKIPVVISNVSCMPETGGDAALYVDPHSPEELAHTMELISKNKDMVQELINKGQEQLQKFTPYRSAESVMNVYKRTAPELFN